MAISVEMEVAEGEHACYYRAKGRDSVRDFPIFTTDYGVASLVLKEIPYKKEAYICIRDVQPEGVEELLKECVGFCRMAGAEQIYASGHDLLEAYPHYTTVVEMCASLNPDPTEMAQLFPVTEQTVARWREVFQLCLIV